ncbi:VOC family protein [Sorangium sp. So ce136]|uniref:VOC family protein n=1 Tax=Sorangium sp. So ce136 TaxID=3133284 RepID=UPI003F04BB1C
MLRPVVAEKYANAARHTTLVEPDDAFGVLRKQVVPNQFVTTWAYDALGRPRSRVDQDGAESQCGWLKDRFGLSWQIVPSALPRLLQHPDPAKAARVMQAMMQMKKIDIAQIEAAAR